jgi:hypothetical protein
MAGQEQGQQTWPELVHQGGGVTAHFRGVALASELLVYQEQIGVLGHASRLQGGYALNGLGLVGQGHQGVKRLGRTGDEASGQKNLRSFGQILERSLLGVYFYNLGQTFISPGKRDFKSKGAGRLFFQSKYRGLTLRPGLPVNAARRKGAARRKEAADGKRQFVRPQKKRFSLQKVRRLKDRPKGFEKSRPLTGFRQNRLQMRQCFWVKKKGAFFTPFFQEKAGKKSF